MNSGVLEGQVVPAPHVAPVMLLLLRTWWYVMNEERTGLELRQTEHICGHLWHRYSVTVNQVMVVTVNFQNDDFNITSMNSWFNSLLVNSNPLSRKFTEKKHLSNQFQRCHLSCPYYIGSFLRFTLNESGTRRLLYVHIY